METEVLLKAVKVGCIFKTEDGRKLTAVRDVDLQMKKGECVAIVGESGCGKSTLARMIAGILPVSSGNVEYMQRDVTRAGYEEWRQLRRTMQFIFQDPMDAFSPRMRIGTFLCEPYLNYKICNKNEAKKMAAELLSQVELNPECMEKYPHQLSGGELQRVVIARALALHPAILICDEITSALDVSTQRQVVNLLKDLQKKNKIAILFISHDLALVQNVSDRIAVMYMGNMVEKLESSQILNARHPYTRALLASVFDVHMDRNKEISVLEGEPPDPMKLPKGCAFYSRCRYAASECREKAPRLAEIKPDHQVACWMVCKGD